VPGPGTLSDFGSLVLARIVYVGELVTEGCVCIFTI
jgi:hypothetical protein